MGFLLGGGVLSYGFGGAPFRIIGSFGALVGKWLAKTPTGHEGQPAAFRRRGHQHSALEQGVEMFRIQQERA
jgi:hypothetical protein